MRHERLQTASKLRDIARRIGIAASPEWVRDELESLARQLEHWAGAEGKMEATDERYVVQEIRQPDGGANLRITDVSDDSRIATCYNDDNARLVAKSLNHWAVEKARADAAEARVKELTADRDAWKARAEDRGKTIDEYRNTIQALHAQIAALEEETTDPIPSHTPTPRTTAELAAELDRVSTRCAYGSVPVDDADETDGVASIVRLLRETCVDEDGEPYDVALDAANTIESQAAALAARDAEIERLRAELDGLQQRFATETPQGTFYPGTPGTTGGRP